MSIFRRLHGYLHLRHPKERGQSHRGFKGEWMGTKSVFSLGAWFSCVEQKDHHFFNLGCIGREASCCREKLSAGRRRTRS